MLSSTDVSQEASSHLMLQIGEAVEQAPPGKRISIPAKLDRKVRNFIAGRNRFAAEHVAHLVSVLEHSNLKICSRLNTAAFILLVAIFCQSESSWASHRGLALLRESLNDDLDLLSQTQASLVDDTEGATNSQIRRKARLGNDILEKLICAFLNRHMPGGTRLWCGLLGLELIKGCETNVRKSRDILSKSQSNAGALIKLEQYGALHIVLALLLQQSGTFDLAGGHLQSFCSVVGGSYEASDKLDKNPIAWAQRILNTSGRSDLLSRSHAFVSRICLDDTKAPWSQDGSQVTYVIFVGEYLSAISLQEGSKTAPSVIDLPIENISGTLWKALHETLETGRQTRTHLCSTLTLSLRRKDNPAVFINGKGYSPSTLSFEPSMTRALNELEHLRSMICSSVLYPNPHSKSSRAVSRLSVAKQRSIGPGNIFGRVRPGCKEEQPSVRPIDQMNNNKTRVALQKFRRRNTSWSNETIPVIECKTSEHACQITETTTLEQKVFDVALSPGLGPNTTHDIEADDQLATRITSISKSSADSNTERKPLTTLTNVNEEVVQGRTSDPPKGKRLERCHVTRLQPGRAIRRFSLCSSEEETSRERHGSTKNRSDITSTRRENMQAEVDPSDRNNMLTNLVYKDFSQNSNEGPLKMENLIPCTTLIDESQSGSGDLPTKIEESKNTNLNGFASSLNLLSNGSVQAYSLLPPGLTCQGRNQEQESSEEKSSGAATVASPIQANQHREAALSEVNIDLRKGSAFANPIELSSETGLGDNEDSSDLSDTGDWDLEACPSLSPMVETDENQLATTKIKQNDESHQVAYSVPVEAIKGLTANTSTKRQPIDIQLPVHEIGAQKDNLHPNRLRHIQTVAAATAKEVIDEYFAQKEALQYNVQCGASASLRRRLPLLNTDTPKDVVLPRRDGSFMISDRLGEYGGRHSLRSGLFSPEVSEADGDLAIHVSTSHRRRTLQKKPLPIRLNERVLEDRLRISRQKETLAQSQDQGQTSKKRHRESTENRSGIPDHIRMHEGVNDALRHEKRLRLGKGGCSSPSSASSDTSMENMLTSELSSPSRYPQENLHSRRLSAALGALSRSIVDHFDARHDTAMRMSTLYSATGAHLLAHVGKGEHHVRQRNRVSSVCEQYRSSLLTLPQADGQLWPIESQDEKQLAELKHILEIGRDLAFAK